MQQNSKPGEKPVSLNEAAKAIGDKWRNLTNFEKNIYDKIAAKMKDSPYADIGTKTPADICEYKKRLEQA
jgi:hypothetical protein